jgi:hypothetical protein
MRGMTISSRAYLQALTLMASLVLASAGMA